MKTVLVTGGSRGIGAAVTEKFAKNGYMVVATYRNSVRAAEDLQAKLNDEGCDVHMIRCDMSDLAQVDDLFGRIRSYIRRLDVIVNNAGISVSGTIGEVDEIQLDKLWRTNALACYACCRGGYDLLRKADNPAVVNVSSVWGLYGASCEAAYSMTKHAVVGLTKSLAEEWKFDKIAVNCVCPPVVSTDMCAHLSEEDIAEFCAAHKCKLYTASDVAEDIFRLATDGSSGVILEEK